jgi:hypothetical protein
MSTDDEKGPRGLGAAARASLRLSADEAALEDQRPSGRRRLAALFLAGLLLVAVPLLWLGSGPGGQAVAVLASKSHISGDDDDDGDSSGPGSGGTDDSTADDAASAATTGTGSRDSARTAGTTRNTANTSDDGRSANTRGTGSRNSARSAGTTRGTRGP